jgi:hypothetical protein
VKGKVTYNGKPVVWGSVTLQDEQGQFHQGDLDLNGNYAIDKVPPGKVKVGVFSPNPQAVRPDPAKAKGKANFKTVTPDDDPRAKFLAQRGPREPPPARPRPAPGQWFPLPSQLSDPVTSGVVLEVKKGKEVDLDIPLK